MSITQIKTSFLFSTFMLFVCLNSFFLRNIAAQDSDESAVASAGSSYSFESIDVPGVDFLAVTASSDFEDYAGYTHSADGEKEVGFTLIDGVFTTYDFPGSEKTHFYALGNNGNAAGHYQDSNGLYHGIILENGELRQYDFPGAVQTEIYGLSDATGALTGNYIDASGVRRGFSGDLIIEYPGASATFAYFAAGGIIMGSYIDSQGVYNAYIRLADGRFLTFDVFGGGNLELLVAPGYNNVGIGIVITKAVGDVPRTYVGRIGSLNELRFPGSFSTEGWNINQDGSVVGYYNSVDGRRHGFIARPPGQDEHASAIRAPVFDYTFESIEVEGVDYLELTASSDFEDYAGHTPSPDGGKMVGFTLIDGVFETYDFPGSKGTYFYALSNTGIAAGHYEDSDGLYHGVILENGELRQYDFPGAVQTFIHGISDATGMLTGNFIDALGVTRGFSGDLKIEHPSASATFAEFVNAEGLVVGSYIDVEGVYHAYGRASDGRFATFNLPGAPDLEYFSYHGISDARIAVATAQAVGDVPRTYVGRFTFREIKFPGSLSTEGWNINQDGSVVGHYDSADGRRRGFIARLTTEPEGDPLTNAYHITLSKGLNMISVPLAPSEPMTARTLAKMTDATTVITLDTVNQQFVGWTPTAPDDGFTIEGGKGYIVNVLQSRQVAFVGEAWTNQTEAAAAPAISVKPVQEAWAFVVSGHLKSQPAFDGYQVIVHNLRTNDVIPASVRGDYFAAATADLARRSVVQVGDIIEVDVIGPNGNVESDTLSYKVTPEDLADAVLSIRLDSIGQPKLTQLLQNFPNPFNPETWIPYQLEKSADVTLQIYDTSGDIVRTLDLGFKGQGFYMTLSRAAYWDGRNNLGEQVASGIYFYSLYTPDFSATRKMLILK